MLPEYRQRGIARHLITHIEAWAREQGLPRLRINVRVAQPQNRAYYERLGYQFVEARAHAGYSEPTFVTLEKTLP